MECWFHGHQACLAIAVDGAGPGHVGAVGLLLVGVLVALTVASRIGDVLGTPPSADDHRGVRAVIQDLTKDD